MACTLKRKNEVTLHILYSETHFSLFTTVYFLCTKNETKKELEQHDYAVNNIVGHLFIKLVHLHFFNYIMLLWNNY